MLDAPCAHYRHSNECKRTIFTFGLCIFSVFGKVDILMVDENVLTGVFIMRENSPMLNECSTNISIWKAFNVYVCFFFHSKF